MLFQINDLRTDIETAKRVLTKEKLDKQKAGQSSMSPFMKASKENTKKNNKRGVSFDALETIDRRSDSMDKLASLVSKLDMKLDKKETQYRPKVYQGRNRGYGQRQVRYRSRDRSYSRGHGQCNYRGRRNYRFNYRNRNRSRNGYRNRRMIGKITEEIVIDRIMVVKGTEIEVQVKIMVDPGKDIEVTYGITQIQEIDTVVETKA